MATATVTPIVPTKTKLLMDECQRLATRKLPEILKLVLTDADDVLFKFANGADNSRRQNAFFDAMRELRLRRGEVEERFAAGVRRRLVEAAETAPTTTGGLSTSFEGELALLGLDEVEEKLAITNFVASARQRCSRELHGVEQRLAVLLKQPKLNDETNPLGPQALGDELMQACAVLTADIETKITLYKLFDRIATPALLNFYAELNQLLVKGGVLPTLNATTPHAAPSRRTRVIIESDGEQVEASGDDVFSTLTSLMQTHQSRGGAPLAVSGGPQPSIVTVGQGAPGLPGLGGVAGGMGAFGLPGAGGFGAMPSGAGGAGGLGGAGGFPAIAFDDAGGGFASVPMLVQSLTDLQRGEGPWVNAVTGGVASGAPGAAPVNVLRGLRASGAVGQLAPAQDMTLEIVSLLFDYIMQDRSIPDALKALIGRLQIPMLKVALLERELFSHKNHPARRLLDTFARAAVGWYEGLRQSDALYDKMEQAVERIVVEFEQDVGLFELVLEDFNAFIEFETRRADDKVAKSSRSLRTREQIVLAKMAVDDELRARLKGFDVREFVQDFLLDYWRQLLIITHVEQGVDSDAWREQWQTVDDLVWSVQPKNTPEDRKALSARLPTMLKCIKRGMVTLEMPPPECSKFLSMLASLHVVAIKNIEESSIAARKLAATPDPTAPAAGRRADVDDPTSDAFVKRGLARIFERKVGEPLELDIDFSAFEAAPAPAVARIDETPRAALDPAPLDEATLERYVEEITTLDLGDWMEFTDDEGGAVRGRFTWIAPTTGRYLFTNRQGEVMREATLVELASALARQQASIIRAESDPLFDRVLAELIDKLEAQTAAA